MIKDPLSGAQHRMNLPALIAVLLGVAIVTMDISLTSTAIPAIAQGIGVPAANTIWIINVYYLAVIAALLPLAALGEIHGHRKIFFSGLGVFVLGSFASGLAGSLEMLMAGRAVLGLGAAAVSATTPALIRALYPPEKLGRGLGLYAMVVGIAFTVGPTIASSILAVANWQWLFLINAPIAMLSAVLAIKSLPATDLNARSFDIVSALLCAGMFASMLFGIAGMAHLGRQSVAFAAVVCVVCGYALKRREENQAAFLAFDLLRIPLFALSAATSICAFTIQGLALVVLPFLFHFKLGYTLVEAGFLITPWPATLAIMTFVAPPLTERISIGVLGCIGLLKVAIGLACMATLPSSAGIFDIAWRLILCGVGFGLFQSPNMLAMMNSVPPGRSGSAGGILAASRLLGQSIGAASVAYCILAWPIRGIDAAIWLGSGIAILGAGVSLLRVAPFVLVTPMMLRPDETGHHVGDRPLQ